MAKKFLKLSDAAQRLGISEDELTAMRDNGDIRGFRDGKGWKFRDDELQRVADDLAAGDQSIPLELDDAGPDLISDSQIGIGGGSTVIGGSDQPASPADSDLKIAEEDSELAGGSELDLQSDLNLEVGDASKDSGVGGQFEDLDNLELELEAGSEINLGGSEELALGEGDSGLSEQQTSIQKGADAGDSAIDLTGDDDELVLGGAADSDVTLDASESGISLASPSESGLSLEEPLELGGSAVDSFELGEDDAISLEDDGEGDSPTQLQADDDFLLTPTDDDGDLSSDSQVIALDEEDPFEVAASPGGALDVAPLEAQGETAAAAGAMGMAPAMPEAPYSIWNVLSLFCCIIFLMLTGMMMYDLMTHANGWDSADAAPSSIMDWIIDTFVK